MNIGGSCHDTGNAGSVCLSVRSLSSLCPFTLVAAVPHAEPSRGTSAVLTTRRKPPGVHARSDGVRAARSTRRVAFVPEQQPAERCPRRSHPAAQRPNNACSRPPCWGDFPAPLYTEAVPPGNVVLGRSAADADRWPAPTSARLLLLLAHQQHPALSPLQSAAVA
jgi:hypothetical protein